MKKLKSLEKILLIIAVAICICSISTVNKATGTGDVNDLFNIPKVENNTVPENNQTENINTIGTVQNTNTNTNTTLPKTGVNDTAMWVLIGACGVAAIYTYKKVRDYNI